MLHMRTLAVLCIVLSAAYAQAPGLAVVGANCTSAVKDCLLDWYKCQVTSCIGGACVRSNVPNGQWCADMQNNTNWDYCDEGLCFGSTYNSTWVLLTTFYLNQSPAVDPNFPSTLQIYIQNATGLSNGVSNTTMPLPGVRTCLERTQRFSTTFYDGTSSSPLIINTCAPVYQQAVAGPSNSFSYFIWVEMTAQNGNSTALATRLAQAANAGALSRVFIASASVIQNPYDQPEYVPWENGWRLAIAIGVATGVFLLSIGFCVLYYMVKSLRDAGGYAYSTDSTASVQSGASAHSRSESQASATEL